MTDEIKRAAEEKLRDYIFVCLCKYSANEIDQNTFLNVVKYVRDEAVAFERRKAYEDSIAAVNNEPELTDEMPDEMWETIKNDRALYSEVLRAVVVSTKRNIANEIRRRMEGV